MEHVKNIVVGLCLSLCLPLFARAQFVQDFKSTARRGVARRWRRPNSSTHSRTGTNWGRYHQDDLRLEKAPAVEGRVVFLGDSITDGWDFGKNTFPENLT